MREWTENTNPTAPLTREELEHAAIMAAHHAAALADPDRERKEAEAAADAAALNAFRRAYQAALCSWYEDKEGCMAALTGEKMKSLLHGTGRRSSIEEEVRKSAADEYDPLQDVALQIVRQFAAL